jgi:tRNA-2-methylthio-N6-dimethylallyladenosine synthase
VVFGTHNVGRAAELLREARAGGPITEILEQGALDDAESFPSALPVKREVDYAAWVTIQVGCDNNCAFCIVPSVRGAEASRPFGDLVAEVERLAADGVVEVTLLGQNVNSYGRDLTTRLRGTEADASGDALVAGEAWAADPARRPRPLFADLLRAAGAVEGISRVRYTSPHPKDLRPETITAMADTPAVCEHLHLPLQSGSDRILAAMHRGYTADRYLDKLAAARAGVPDLAVSTDIIVGFPGETEDDFERTLEVTAAADYDSAYTFIFSAREGTEAAGHDRPLRRPRGVGRTVRSAPSRGRAFGPAAQPGPRRSRRGGHRRRAIQARPVGAHRPHPPEQAGALPGRCSAAGRHDRHRRGHRRRRPSPAGPPLRGAGHPPTPHPHPRHRRLRSR